MSSGFISETEIAEQRRLRQEEWERVRQPHEPQEAPEEEIDHRSLFERLEEQKKKKEFEYEEAHRLKNMIKGLDDDEVDFLDLVDRSKMEEERKKAVEEQREIADFRNRVASLQEQGIQQRIQQEIRQQPAKTTKIATGKTSQTKLLAGAVVKKRPVQNGNDSKEPSAHKRPKHEEDKPLVTKDPSASSPGSKIDESSEKRVGLIAVNADQTIVRKSAASCVAILPGFSGLGSYCESSDESDASTDVDEAQSAVQYDLAGRPIKPAAATEESK
ncbi:NEFA-interacting nuclear protein NIP30 [Nesidiocoris tenuis]|uniref:NEFA-interacting nuclear protein NIP30 n=1 Tax=Nesidiocoris tenuis TaxID=355587 RepID=A0ABN7AWN0_9HEMI|nr:NEFA-interacting nuclear protein NIP30 [Nesidiocoris tenuis]